MTPEPLVTVLLPVHNAGRYFFEAFASVLDQTYRNLDVLVIDDGSTDGAVDDAIERRPDPRVRLLRQQNRGLAATLNRGLAEARGSLVARMDADDVALRDRIERQVRRMVADPRLVLLGGQIHRRVGGRVGAISAFPLRHDEIVTGLLHRTHVLCHPAVMLRTDAARLVDGYWEHGPAEDWDLFLRLSQVGRLANLPEAVLHYRFHESGINAESLAVVRRNIALAVVNHERRALGRYELDPRELDSLRWLGVRLSAAAETRSLTSYRRALQAGAAGKRVRSALGLAVSAAWWPAQAARRVVLDRVRSVVVDRRGTARVPVRAPAPPRVRTDGAIPVPVERGIVAAPVVHVAPPLDPQGPA